MEYFTSGTDEAFDVAKDVVGVIFRYSYASVAFFLYVVLFFEIRFGLFAEKLLSTKLQVKYAPGPNVVKDNVTPFSLANEVISSISAISPTVD